MKIQDWLESFKRFWINKDLESVLSLFTDEVVYFETPFLQLKSKKEILNEWKEVLTQEDIKLDYSVFSEAGNKNTISWDLSYKRNNQTFNLKGIYLVQLDKQGLCNYFYQACESEDK